jgi:hypothetical protein
MPFVGITRGTGAGDRAPAAGLDAKNGIAPEARDFRDAPCPATIIIDDR